MLLLIRGRDQHLLLFRALKWAYKSQAGFLAFLLAIFGRPEGL